MKIQAAWVWVLAACLPGLTAHASPSLADAESSTQPKDQTTPFLLGVNYPWYNYGSDFGTNAWNLGGVSDPRSFSAVEQDFAFMREHGVKVVRWFIFCDGRTAPTFNDAGYVTGLDDRFYADFDAALNLAGRYGLKLIPVLFNQDLVDPPKIEGGVRVGGHTDLIMDLAKRQSLLDLALAPLFQRYGRRTEIEAWEIMNEPELSVDGLGGRFPRILASFEGMHAFLGAIAEYAHYYARQPVTVGSWQRNDMNYWSDIGLDLYEYHYYDSDEIQNPFKVPYSELGLGKPCFVGEFPSQTTRWPLSKYLDSILTLGYSGGFPWSLRATDPYSNFRAHAEEYRTWVEAHPNLP